MAQALTDEQKADARKAVARLDKGQVQLGAAIILLNGLESTVRGALQTAALSTQEVALDYLIDLVHGFRGRLKEAASTVRTEIEKARLEGTVTTFPAPCKIMEVRGQLASARKDLHDFLDQLPKGFPVNRVPRIEIGRVDEDVKSQIRSNVEDIIELLRKVHSLHLLAAIDGHELPEQIALLLYGVEACKRRAIADQAFAEIDSWLAESQGRDATKTAEQR